MHGRQLANGYILDSEVDNRIIGYSRNNLVRG